MEESNDWADDVWDGVGVLLFPFQLAADLIRGGRKHHVLVDPTGTHALLPMPMVQTRNSQTSPLREHLSGG